ncbi:helix-turn-helix transcriptional regulator [Ruania halotolerans]|uniref:helix-turn-helix transcriptional regulator n=1 Tax=Ruania halotolerans TaxID=2897773 RepID=UPI001E596890|nr:WYL domain-containing protein [Ruania halotolerans]UFU08281.1 WYL domain-containing protein [Ruania halotolerans]
MKSERVPAAERLLDLVIALSHTRHRMTKSDIRRQVNGYADAVSDESFDRMFERDKDQLRGLGIPIVTLTDSAHEDDVGYRIDMTEYSLPPVNFTPAEVGVLSLAAQVWQDSSFATQSQRGLTKLRAVSDLSDPAEHTGLALRVRGPDAAFGDLLDAITDRIAVQFTYRAANTGATGERTVEPWRLVARDRGWYLIGFDRLRQAQRSYRLSRIIGTVHRVGTPGQVQIPQTIEPQPVPTTEVVLALTPERASALRARSEPANHLGAPADRDVVRLEVTEVGRLAEEIAGYGEHVLVLEPAELRSAVLRRLRAAQSWGEI